MHSDFVLFPCLFRGESKSEKLAFALKERGFLKNRYEAIVKLPDVLVNVGCCVSRPGIPHASALDWQS